jgi:hypothetical protein
MTLDWIIVGKMVLYAIFLWPKRKVNYEKILEHIPVGGIFTEDLFHVLYISGYIPEESYKWKKCFYDSLADLVKINLIYYSGECYVDRT